MSASCFFLSPYVALDGWIGQELAIPHLLGQLDSDKTLAG